MELVLCTSLDVTGLSLWCLARQWVGVSQECMKCTLSLWNGLSTQLQKYVKWVQTGTILPPSCALKVVDHLYMVL